MSLADILGQPVALALLRSLRASGRLAHAYLFHGPEGVGKFTAAVALAAAGLCRAAGPDGACGRCPDCARVARGEHPGLIVVALPPDKSLIPIGEPPPSLPSPGSVRWALERVTLKSPDGRDRWILVRDAEWLSEEAANALLKTLEEPPPAVRLVLTTARPRTLLPTILSRCHQIAFGPLPDDVVADLLGRTRELDPAKVRWVARYAGGSLGRAVRLLDADFEQRRRWLIDRYVALGPGDLFAFAEEVGEWAKEAGGGEESRDRVRLALDVIATFLRDALLVGAGAPPEELSAPEEADNLRRLLARMDLEDVVSALDQIQTTEEEISRNANQKLAFGSFLLADGRIPR